MTGAGAAAGWALDAALGEPPAAAHPVVWFGSAMSALERRAYRDDRWAGVGVVVIGVGGAWLVGQGLTRLLGPTAATAVATAVSVAGRMLDREGLAVVDAVAGGDIDTARARLPTLVGRDPSELDEPEILRAVVESVAENTVDAVIAPVLWAAIGGAPAVLAHRAANTLDAMFGHRSVRYENFGWAPARLDDVLNFVPARLAAVAVAALVPDRAAAILTVIRRDAPRHPSPNGGVVEAAVAAAVGVRLGGTNRYGTVIEDRGLLGSGDQPTVADARRALRLVRRAGALVAAGAALVAGGRVVASRSGSRRQVSHLP
jgi:adenosylcobinamide-phosphate synthase